MCLLTMVLSTGHAAPHNAQALAQQAHARVQAYLLEALPSHLRQQAQIRIEVHGARGAAQRSCSQAWQWQTLQAQHWQRIHIRVACAGQLGSLVARTQVKVPVFTALTHLPKNHQLQPNDVQQQLRTIRSAQDVVLPEQLLHMQLRRPLQAGEALQLKDLVRPLYAKKGQRVEIQAEVGNVLVSTPGIALHSGYQGERIRARNLNSQTWVEGVLIAPAVLRAESTQPGRSVKVQLID